MDKSLKYGYLFVFLYLLDCVLFFYAFLEGIKWAMVMSIIGIYFALRAMRGLKMFRKYLEEPLDLIKQYNIQTVDEHMKDIRR